ncbi:hypothetical protein [Mesorhizobium waimense]|uniref:hypothetical protein n=1 Tax=Mesorhizobium waimense TaxID=1300307 RepID=UPI001ABFCE53|nr:hypothetical protein [Mesorhizobium waimense]
MTVDFETKCYENDWEIVLKPAYLRAVVDRCVYPFSKRRVIINNVSDRAAVEAAARATIEAGALDEYLFAEDHADAALSFFDIDKASFGRGYVYSICELVGLYASNADYLLHFASDSYPKRRHNWIEPAIDLMQSRDDLVTANLCWNDRYKEAKAESFDTAGDFLIGFGFSDQCYLAKLSVFRATIYGERNPASERYPDYADELFEKRVDAYMRNHGAKRLTHRSQSYVHRNIPKGGLKRVWRGMRPLA